MHKRGRLSSCPLDHDALLRIVKLYLFGQVIAVRGEQPVPPLPVLDAVWEPYRVHRYVHAVLRHKTDIILRRLLHHGIELHVLGACLPQHGFFQRVPQEGIILRKLYVQKGIADVLEIRVVPLVRWLSFPIDPAPFEQRLVVNHKLRLKRCIEPLPLEAVVKLRGTDVDVIPVRLYGKEVHRTAELHPEIKIEDVVIDIHLLKIQPVREYRVIIDCVKIFYFLAVIIVPDDIACLPIILPYRRQHLDHIPPVRYPRYCLPVWDFRRHQEGMVRE